MATAVRAGCDPWASTFARLRARAHDQPRDVPRPVTVLVRGAASGRPAENYARLFDDGDRAAQILKAWADTLTTITGISPLTCTAVGWPSPEERCVTTRA